jgi:hypothetical protein
MNTYEDNFYGIEEISRREAAIILQNWWANPRTYQVSRVTKGHYVAINVAHESIATLKIGGKA